ncbi:hypothetical protein ACO0LL_26395 [Undibacterium sp. TC4M20W]|uniref:glycine-rich domain-containing protein n=1 Tax=Undibacterium sp. TC4M20W TaxID=3413052 RepID=UPI003BF17994
MTGFTGFVGAAPRGAGFQVFKASGNFQVPMANYYLVDVFGAGGSGASIATYASGGGGGARHRSMIPAQLMKPGTVVPVIVGAGGGAVTGGVGVGNTGGKSAFGSLVLGFLIEAYGGGGGGNNCGGGGGGICGIGTSDGVGGFPNNRSSNGLITNLNWNAISDLGGANADPAGYGGNAVWGGGSGSSTNIGFAPGASLFAGSGGGGGWSQYRGGKSGAYSGVVIANSINGILHALMGGAGSGGASAQSTSLNGYDGGFPSGGGGGTDSGTSGKGGDGLVVIYWW